MISQKQNQLLLKCNICLSIAEILYFIKIFEFVVMNTQTKSFKSEPVKTGIPCWRGVRIYVVLCNVIALYFIFFPLIPHRR